jgi:hypothetical protein
MRDAKFFLNASAAAAAAAAAESVEDRNGDIEIA